MTTNQEYKDMIKDTLEEISNIIESDLIFKKDLQSLSYDLDLRLLELFNIIDDRIPYRSK